MSETDQAERLRELEAENARLRHLLDSRGLPGSLRHQVRNALGLMRAILRRSAESKTSVEDLAAHLEGRFDALTRVQTAVLSSPDGSIDLFMLVSSELLAQTALQSERVTIDGPPVRLDARRAELLGLVLHELMTNALKFGALTEPQGMIDVTWTLSLPAALSLVWIERGMQRTSLAPPSRGFGLEVIEGMLPYQFKAESRLEFLAEGLRCTIALPLEAPVTPSAAAGEIAAG